MARCTERNCAQAPTRCRRTSPKNRSNTNSACKALRHGAPRGARRRRLQWRPPKVQARLRGAQGAGVLGGGGGGSAAWGAARGRRRDAAVPRRRRGAHSAAADAQMQRQEAEAGVAVWAAGRTNEVSREGTALDGCTTGSRRSARRSPRVGIPQSGRDGRGRARRWRRRRRAPRRRRRARWWRRRRRRRGLRRRRPTSGSAPPSTTRRARTRERARQRAAACRPCRWGSSTLHARDGGGRERDPVPVGGPDWANARREGHHVRPRGEEGR